MLLFVLFPMSDMMDRGSFAWPYKFEPLLDTEYTLEWVSKEIKFATVFSTFSVINFMDAKVGYQIQHHWDMAGEIVLDWEWRAKEDDLSSYLVWKCPIKHYPIEHYHVARTWGKMLQLIPGLGTWSREEGAIKAAELDYYNHVHGIKEPVIKEKETLM